MSTEASAQDSATRQPAPLARVSRVSIARLFNLGQYEHARIEISVEVPPGVGGGGVVQMLAEILEDLDPKAPLDGYEKTNALKLASLSAEQVEKLEDWQQSNREVALLKLAQLEAWKVRRAGALAALDRLGGTSVYRDAKDEWDDQP